MKKTWCVVVHRQGQPVVYGPYLTEGKAFGVADRLDGDVYHLDNEPEWATPLPTGADRRTE